MTTERFSLNGAGAFIGKDLGTSDWITMSQARINQFAECTNDYQWIHVNVERAKRETPFGSTIAHGYLTLAMLAETLFEVVSSSPPESARCSITGSTVCASWPR
jgi:acyl dehydratase